MPLKLPPSEDTLLSVRAPGPGSHPCPPALPCPWCGRTRPGALLAGCVLSCLGLLAQGCSASCHQARLLWPPLPLPSTWLCATPQPKGPGPLWLGPRGGGGHPHLCGQEGKPGVWEPDLLGQRWLCTPWDLLGPLRCLGAAWEPHRRGGGVWAGPHLFSSCTGRDRACSGLRTWGRGEVGAGLGQRDPGTLCAFLMCSVSGLCPGLHK